MEGTAESLLALPDKPEIGAGGELILSPAEAAEAPGLACTVEDPDMTIAVASRERLELAAEAQVMSQAVDMAETIRAKDSLRKGMAHQLAALHQLFMRFAAKANGWLDRSDPRVFGTTNAQIASVEAQRAANASARLSGAYQEGMLALQRLRTGGKQVVQVQYVNVGDGGQAVVAGSIKGRSKTGGGSGGRHEVCEASLYPRLGQRPRPCAGRTAMTHPLPSFQETVRPASDAGQACLPVPWRKGRWANGRAQRRLSHGALYR
jgi:hypothetical protein